MKYHLRMDNGYGSCYGVERHRGEVQFNGALNPSRTAWDGNSLECFRLPFGWHPIWNDR